MIELEEAQRILLEQVPVGPTVSLKLRDAAGCRLAKAIGCDMDYPPFARSVMDGYAVKAADVAKAPVELRVAGQVPAGLDSSLVLKAGEAIQINTGAPIPDGADAVVRVEITKLSDDGSHVEILESVPEGKFITERATYARAGDVVLEAGAILSPMNMAVAATAGAAEVCVYKKPTAAFLVTGDELVDVDAQPRGAQIRNSNEYLLASLLKADGLDAKSLGVAGDDPAELRRKMEAGCEQGVLITTGGISMGAFDFVPRILEELGAEMLVHKIAIKPGRPTIVARMPGGAWVFALPGNPLSALVGYELMVRPALSRMQGGDGKAAREMQAICDGELSAVRDRQTFIPAVVRVNDDGAWAVRLLSWFGSGDAVGAANANALIHRPAHAAAVTRGDIVSVMLLPHSMDV